MLVCNAYWQMVWHAICIYLVVQCRKPSRVNFFLFHACLLRCFVIVETCHHQLIYHNLI